MYEAYLGSLETSRSPHLPAIILKVYILMEFSHVASPDGLNNSLLSQVSILENVSHCGNSGWNIYTSQKQERGWGSSNCPGPAYGANQC